MGWLSVIGYQLSDFAAKVWTLTDNVSQSDV